MDATSLAIAGATFASGTALGMAFAMTKSLSQPVAAAPAPAPQVVPVEAPAPPAPKADIDAGRPGWTMQEAREQADAGQAAAFKRAPREVLEELQRGNVRFWTGGAVRPEKSAFERRALINKQFPSTAILSCADSRVPTEIVFDQHLGDMFVVRCARNAVTETTMGSLQYSVNHLKVKVLMVMGHEGCGAVKAAGLPEDALRGEPSELCNCLLGLKRGLDFQKLKCIEDTRAHDREAVISNVKQQVMALTRDPSIMKKVVDKELLIVGAFYEISSGIVDFFFEVSSSQDLAFLTLV
jgi:carbonic anhydrase